METSRPHIGQRLWHSWCVDLNDAGRSIILAGLVAVVVGSTTTYIDTYLMVGFFGCLGLMAIVLVFLFRPQVTLSTNLPRKAVAGQTLSFSVWVKNASSRVIRDMIVHPVEPSDPIVLEPQEQSIEKMEIGETREFHFTTHCPRRGIWRFSGVWADTMFPFGWIRTGLEHDSLSANIIVYPWFSPLQELNIATGRRYQQGGIPFVSHIGDSAEYIGNREYHEGDNLRLVDWKSWARLGFPVVREYQEEYFCRIALVVDTHIPGKKITPAQRRDFEALLSLTAAIADYLSRQEYLLDIFAAGSKVYILETGRSLTHFDHVLEVLSCLDPSPHDTLLSVQPALQDHIAGMSSLIAVLLDWDQETAKFLEPWIGLGVGIKVIVCNSFPPTQPKVPFLQAPNVQFQWRTAAEIVQGIAVI